MSYDESHKKRPRKGAVGGGGGGGQKPRGREISGRFPGEVLVLGPGLLVEGHDFRQMLLNGGDAVFVRRVGG